MLAVSGKPKLKYIGYSRGSSIMFIGLALNEESYFASRVSKFIAIAPCIYTNEVKFFGQTESYDDAVRAFTKLDEQNIYRFKSFGEAVSVNDLLYFEQIRIEDRFQEFIPLDDYASGTRRSNQLSLASINQVPITMIAGTKDPICSNDASWRIYSELRNTERTFR